LNLTSGLHSHSQIQLITATHSPLVLASAEPTFDSKKDAWFDLDLDHTNNGDRVQLQKREFVRRGDVSSWLTSEAFGLKEPMSIEAEEAITRALTLLRRDAAPSTKEIDDVDRLLRKSLSDVDRFWVRWSQYRKNHKAGK
jgi:hypothetical protein